MSRYTATAVILHWLIAALVVGQFAWGWLMQEIPKSPPGMRADAFNFHKSIGLCLLALMLFRIGWRIAHPPPPLPAMPAWQARLAVWSGYPVKWFGIVLPDWGTKSPALKDAMSAVHYVTSWVLLSLVALHVAGALRHAFRGEGVMSRMTLARRAGRRRTATTRLPAVD